MSRENVELVGRFYAALLDLRDADPDEDQAFLDRAFRDFFDGQCELRMPAEYPEGEQVLWGREGLAQLVAMLRDAWAEWRFEPERLIDAGERVVVLVRVVAKGGASGVQVELETAHVLTFRDARVSSVRVYRDRGRALDAVGLREQAVSQVNVELVHRGYDALARRDLDALLALMDPEVEIAPLIAVALGATYRGHDGVRRFWSELVSSFPDFTAEVVEVRDLGDRTLAAVRSRAHGAGSDAPFEETAWQLAEGRDGKLLRLRSYASESEALEAAGIREP